MRNLFLVAEVVHLSLGDGTARQGNPEACGDGSLGDDVGWVAPSADRWPLVTMTRLGGLWGNHARDSMPAMQIVELCRSCRHERASHRQEDGRCTESIEALVDEVGVAVAILCDCPGWPGRR